MKYLKSFESNSKENKNHAILKKNGDRFWIGTVNTMDGEIEEYHTFERRTIRKNR